MNSYYTETQNQIFILIIIIIIIIIITSCCCRCKQNNKTFTKYAFVVLFDWISVSNILLVSS